MIESLHHVIDQLAGIFLTFLGEVEIEHGGFELSMAQVALDDAQVDTGFEEMGGVAMAQGVDRDAFFEYTGGVFGLTKSALDAAFSHWGKCPFGARAASANSGEEQLGMAVSAPILA